MEEQKRYIKNAPSVRKLGKIYNFQFHGCEPDWRILRINQNNTSDIPDWLMGILAKDNGLSWVFRSSNRQLQKDIKNREEYLAQSDKMMIYYEKHRKKLDISKDDPYNPKGLLQDMKTRRKEAEKDIKDLETELNERKHFSLSSKRKSG